jgi:hypothetical protein
MRAVSSAVIGDVSATCSNATDRVPPAPIMTFFGAATSVGPSISVTVALAPVSVFSSARSTTTSTARVASVCGGALTAEIMRSGLSFAVVSPRR